MQHSWKLDLVLKILRWNLRVNDLKWSFKHGTLSWMIRVVWGTFLRHIERISKLKKKNYEPIQACKKKST